MKVAFVILVFLAMMVFTGCTGPRKPVLYPNQHLTSVGQYQSEADIHSCMQAAEASGANSEKGRQLVGNTAKAGAVGGATGAVVGAVSSSSNIGRGATVGGAGAATAALVGGAFKSSVPTQVYMRFVEQCLRDKGYQPIGWR